MATAYFAGFKLRTLGLLAFVPIFAIVILLADKQPTRKTPPQATVPLAPVVAIADGPFGPREAAVDFPTGLDWINTKSSLSLKDLRGKLVLLDFWTYCCINCMHVLPVLDQAESKYANELVVVGVHTAKFETERDTQNIREAILRYEIKHPVINDSEHRLWDKLKVSTWPTLMLIDPEGYLIWGHSGEIPFAELDKVLEKAIAFYKRKDLIDRRAVRFDLVEDQVEPTPLRFPGKILADAASNRLFISDSNHNRIVISSLDGKLETIIGSGKIGAEDGGYEVASLHHPQGLALYEDQLWIADTENHLIRRVDLKQKQVVTVAGTGKQTDTAWPGLNPNNNIPKKLSRSPKATSLGSPWDLLVHDGQLYIAMAGPHQIWKMDLSGKSISQFAGNGREDIVDGALLPTKPYAADSSSFAQPSGLSTDGKFLYVADSEGSSIRAIPFNGGKVQTVIGTSTLKTNRLFTFGDVDGVPGKALLQHPLAVANSGNSILVADTYNNKIRSVDRATGMVTTLLGEKTPGNSDQPARFDEPSGLSIAGDLLFIADTNNHAIRVADLKSGELKTLKIDGLTTPVIKYAGNQITLPKSGRRVKVDAQQVSSSAKEITVEVDWTIAEGWKLNDLAKFPYVAVQTTDPSMNSRGTIDLKKGPWKIAVSLAESNSSKLEIGASYYYCRTDGQGLCLADSVIFEIPIERKSDSKNSAIKVTHEIEVKP